MGRRSDISSWGSSAWTFMHVVTWTYPEVGDVNSRTKAFDFIHSLAQVIPCMRCRSDWQEYLTKNFSSVETMHLDSRASFTKFIVDGHNYVNHKIGKREYTYEEARSLYDPNAPPLTISNWIPQAITVSCIILAFVVYQIVFRSYSQSVKCQGPLCGSRVAPGCD